LQSVRLLGGLSFGCGHLCAAILIRHMTGIGLAGTCVIGTCLIGAGLAGEDRLDPDIGVVWLARIGLG
ncbi:MAG TPA: hypothetical protein DGU02_06095, partial [Alphaproteobacteria bacterium]|nr:hypothetical protein [Alphaproteobacteria bacterium]